LIGGILGAGIAEAGIAAPHYDALMIKVVLPLVLSPVIGFFLAYLLMVSISRLIGRQSPTWIQRVFGQLQVASSALMAFSHGSNDAQKTMGVITLALIAYGAQTTFDVPIWVILISAMAMALGTASGGWRIMRTMGTRLADLRPIHGFAAETTAGILIEIASRLGFPLSTTQVISASILGVGAARRLRAVRWNIAGNIVTAWIFTIPVCAGLAWGIVSAVRFLGL
jgi:PiT family inorganic phosphate transporter